MLCFYQQSRNINGRCYSCIPTEKIECIKIWIQQKGYLATEIYNLSVYNPYKDCHGIQIVQPRQR